MKIRVLLLLAVAGSAMAQFETPRLGCFAQGGRLYRVLGISGNFLLSPSERDGILSAACSDKLTLVGTAGALEWSESRHAAPPGPALFAFAGDGASALAYFPSSAEWFLLSRSGSMRAVRGPGRGEKVLAIARPERPAAIVRRGESLWLISSGEEIELPGVAPPVLLAGGRLLFADGSELVVRDAGEERRLALAGAAVALEPLGAGWVRVQLAGGGHLAIALRPGREHLYTLPEVKP